MNPTLRVVYFLFQTVTWHFVRLFIANQQKQCYRHVRYILFCLWNGCLALVNKLWIALVHKLQHWKLQPMPLLPHAFKHVSAQHFSFASGCLNIILELTQLPVLIWFSPLKWPLVFPHLKIYPQFPSCNNASAVFIMVGYSNALLPFHDWGFSTSMAISHTYLHQYCKYYKMYFSHKCA